MKQITLKATLIIDGRKVLVDSQDPSESVAEYEKHSGKPLDDKEIINYITQPWNYYPPSMS